MKGHMASYIITCVYQSDIHIGETKLKNKLKFYPSLFIIHD